MDLAHKKNFQSLRKHNQKLSFEDKKRQQLRCTKRQIKLKDKEAQKYHIKIYKGYLLDQQQVKAISELYKSQIKLALPDDSQKHLSKGKKMKSQKKV